MNCAHQEAAANEDALQHQVQSNKNGIFLLWSERYDGPGVTRLLGWPSVGDLGAPPAALIIPKERLLRIAAQQLEESCLVSDPCGSI